MTNTKRPLEAFNQYLDEQSSRIVAESGRPSDRFHLGKLILLGLRDAPSFVLQIDGGLDIKETSRSVLDRSVRCAEAIKGLGFRVNDVIVLMAPNHLEVCIPMYAALYLGMPIAATDATLGIEEMKYEFNFKRPKIIFCQNTKAPEIQKALDEINFSAMIITFDKSDSYVDLKSLLDKHNEVDSNKFTATNFATDKVISFMFSTSGTTGLPKAAAVTHKSFKINNSSWWYRFAKFPEPFSSALIVSPIQWISAITIYVMSPIFRVARVQSSLPATIEHCNHLINTYKPECSIMNPVYVNNLLKRPGHDICDFSSFKTIMLGGCAVPVELISLIKKLNPHIDVCTVFGCSEACLTFNSEFGQPLSSVGKPIGYYDYRLVDIDSGNDITEPHKQGELWVKGLGLFTEYYNNPEATKEAFAEGGWFKTGDLLYRDEQNYYYFVDRLKLLLKYKNHQISPLELEEVIQRYPGVLDVAVSGISNPECGDLPVAFVVLKRGCKVSAEEIKGWVIKNLSESKHLRGGVIFLDELPLTPTAKVDRRKLKELAFKLAKE